MKFHQKRPIKQLSHHLKEYSLKNPKRMQTFVLISGDFLESMLQKEVVIGEKGKKYRHYLQIILN
jgi:hypothetical protein